MALFVNPLLVFAISLALLTSCGGQSSSPQTEDRANVVTMDSLLTKFDQELSSPQKQILLKPGQTTTIPVTIRNLTGVTLISIGRYPITLGYRWYEKGKELAIGDDRTLLSRPLKPGEQDTVEAKVTALQSSSSDLTLRFSLVQEGVAWFYTKGAPGLELPVRIEQ